MESSYYYYYFITYGILFILIGFIGYKISVGIKWARTVFFVFVVLHGIRTTHYLIIESGFIIFDIVLLFQMGLLIYSLMLLYNTESRNWYKSRDI